ncbi:MAG: AraC family transcriptional regulator [Monoglobales bacterium]
MRNELVKSNLKSTSARVSVGNLSQGLRQGSLVPMHFHDEIELLFVHNGRFRFISNDICYDGGEGDIYFVNSRIPHSTVSLCDGTVTSLLQFIPDGGITDARYLSRFINISKEPVKLFKKDNPITKELSDYLMSIFREFENKENFYELYIKTNLCGITAFLSRYEILTDISVFFCSKDIAKVMPALQYIDENYASPLTLSDVSSTLNLDPSYFCRLFKRATNSTFTDYLNFVRVCKSEKLLSGAELAIADIALDVGFSSVSYFNKIFRKYKNCTPTQYRNSKYINQ